MQDKEKKVKIPFLLKDNCLLNDVVSDNTVD